MGKENDFAIKAGSGLDLIIKERERQISEEGWTPEHDAQHNGGELAVAAACYAVEGLNDDEDNGTFVQRLEGGVVEDGWPKDWDSKWDKREKHDQLKRLTIAGALIAAEIDRIQAGA
jgi:hypothetical protein